MSRVLTLSLALTGSSTTWPLAWTWPWLPRPVLSLRSKGSCRGCRRSAGRGPAGRLPAGPRWPAGDPPGAPCSRAAGRRAGRCARAWRASPRRLSYFPAEASLQCRRAVAESRWPPCRFPQSWPFPARLPCRSSEPCSSLAWLPCRQRLPRPWRTLCRPLPFPSRRRWRPSPPACPCPRRPRLSRLPWRHRRLPVRGWSSPRRSGQRRDRCFPPAWGRRLAWRRVKSANSFCQSSWPSFSRAAQASRPWLRTSPSTTSCLARSRVVAATSRLASLASGLPWGELMLKSASFSAALSSSSWVSLDRSRR